jgi:hypothetical protein
MATVSISLNFVLNMDTGVLSTSVSPHNLYRGDTAVFTVQGIQAANGAAFTSFYAGAWESSIWVDSSDVYLTGAVDGTTFSKVVRADSVFDSDTIGVDTIIDGVFRYSNVGPITVSLPVDAQPDQFDLGPNISGLQPADTFVSSLVTISGITTSVNASVSTTGGTAYFTVNNGTSQTSATVSNGQRIQVFGTASPNYSDTATVTLNIGGVTDSINVTTTNTPPAESLIPFPVTGVPIALSQVKAFFGGTDPTLNTVAPNNMRSYYRGSSRVPDISQNDGIPSSGQIKLTDFIGSYTTLYFTKFPRSISKNMYTGNGSVSTYQTWSLGSSGDDKFDIGFGPGMRGAVDFSYSLSQDTGGGKSTGVTLVVASGGSAGTYNPGNNYVTVQSPTVTGNSEARYSGTVTINVRSKYSPYPVKSTTVKYFFNFYGP